MIRIAIIDDEIEFARQIEKITKHYFEIKKLESTIVVYKYPKELLWDIEECYFDIYLIDIEMPAVSGIELAHAIRQKYDEPYIIFITSHLKYSIEGYECNVWRYIIKDDVKEKLPLAFESLENKLRTRQKKFYVIETYSEVIKIAYDDIYYLHKDGKYTYFYTRQKLFRERMPIKQIYDKLDGKEFIFADKSYIVNLRHVMTLGDHVMKMRNGDEVPVSIPQFQKVKQAISEYWREEL